MKPLIYRISIIVFVLFQSESLRADLHVSLGGERYGDEELIDQVKFYAEELGLKENVFIRVNFSLNLPDSVMGTADYQSALPGMHQVVILINKRAGRSSQLNTLAHEMVHAAQFVNQDLVLLGEGKTKWKGITYDVRDVAYNDLPWEIEAREETIRLRRMYLDRKKSEGELVF